MPNPAAHRYNGQHRPEWVLEFQTFDAAYVRRLTDGDPATESHFSTYFEKYLSMKLRSRQISGAMADDVRQETLYRVLKTLREGPGVSQPERFGAFVNSVCNNVLLEVLHKKKRDGDIPEDPPETADQRIDIDASLISEERKRMVAIVLDDLSPKDREILRLIFFEDLDRKAICDRLHVEPDYLRVLLHRAKAKFQTAYTRRHGVVGQVMLFVCNVAILRITI
jgi:RNA polymerase sigma factor (sigma-70 family)